MAPSLCGSLVNSKRSLLALGWTITSLLSVGAFITAALYAAQIKTHYKYLANNYSNDDDDYYRDCQEGGEGEEGESGEGGEGNRCNSHDSRDEHDAAYYFSYLASVSSGSMTFAGIYTASLAVALSLYGSLAIVGFSSVRGQYIAPCLGGGGTAIQSRIHLGIFMGALVLFSNLCLVCAVIFGEFRVEDYLDDEKREELGLESYAVERIATVLAVLCMFLAVLYFSYAVLLFAFKDNLIEDLTRDGKEMEMGSRRSISMRAPRGEDTNETMAGASQLGYEPPMGNKMHQDENGFITTQSTESF